MCSKSQVSAGSGNKQVRGQCQNQIDRTCPGSAEPRAPRTFAIQLQLRSGSCGRRRPGATPGCFPTGHMENSSSKKNPRAGRNRIDGFQSAGRGELFYLVHVCKTFEEHICICSIYVLIYSYAHVYIFVFIYLYIS